MARILTKQLKAISHESRLALLQWLKDPVANFPPQRDGDLIKDGVCSVFIARKWGVAPPTATRHLSMLRDAKFLIATRKKGWTFYRRNEAEILRFRRKLSNDL